MLRKAAEILQSPVLYRLWQSPFVRAKIAPLWRHAPPGQPGRVLDVGCGPGTNSRLFNGADYCGLDLSPRFVQYAQQHYAGRFIEADARRAAEFVDGPFDLILSNSLLHHIDDDGVRTVLRQLASLLSTRGRVHIMDLVLPERASVARYLARNDRGDYPRPLEAWRHLFAESFEPVVFEPYNVGAFGLPLWKMVYFQGKARSAAD